jgi:Tat protein translocase TatB subunit
VIQGSEFFIILLVALIVLGPQRLPDVARKLGRWAAELRRAAADLRAGLEAEVGDVRAIADDIKAPVREAQEALRDTTRLIDENGEEGSKPASWKGPKPVSGPTPEDAMRDLEEIEATGTSLGERPAPPEEHPEAAGGAA